jgi:hypothetical protein
MLRGRRALRLDVRRQDGDTATMSKRGEIAPIGDKRYVRRDDKGRIKTSIEEGASLSTDTRHKAKNAAKLGQGDRASAESKPEHSQRRLADRTALTAAEAAVQRLDADRREELDFDRDTRQRAYVEKRKAATASVIKARQAYRKAGGKD